MSKVIVERLGGCWLHGNSFGEVAAKADIFIRQET